MKHQHLIGAALAVALAGTGLCACSSPASTATTVPAAAAPAATAQPAPALPILRESGATQQASHGYDIEGDGNASGQFASGEQVTVYTFADQAAMSAASARTEGFTATSDYVWITGPLFAVEVTAVNDSQGNPQFPVSAQEVARRVSGTVAGGSQ